VSDLDDELIELGYDPNDPELESLLVQDQAADLEWLDQVGARWPLSVSILWDADRAACDQRRAVAGAMLAPSLGIIVGGNRSGKTSGMLDMLVAHALGGDHPAVVEWCRQNGLPNTIPPGPAEVFLVAQSSSDSMRYHRPDIDERVGEGKEWTNRNGKGEALLTIRVPGYDEPAKIWFKSLDQKRKSFQGVSLRFVGIDEEPLGEEGQGILDECLLRVADQRGLVVISMTPLAGLTWMYDRYFTGKEQPGVRIYTLDTLDNPHLPRDFFEALFAGLDADALAQRRHGQFRSRSGAVYQAWAPGDGTRFGPGHVYDPEDFEIPADWPRYRCADFGLRVPTCVLWLAVGDDDTVYVYDEHYEAERTWDEHGAIAAERERGQSVQCGWADPSGEEAIATFAAHGVLFALANREVKAGIDEVKDRLRLQKDNRPRLKVSRRCVNLIREFPDYVWDANRKDDVPVKKNDHALDALRYGLMGLRELGGY
jgi:hypothetical protein